MKKLSEPILSDIISIDWRHYLFRYDSAAKVIIYAWVNDVQSLRSAGSKTDPYIVFSKMLVRGCPPDDWEALVKNSQLDLN